MPRVQGGCNKNNPQTLLRNNVCNNQSLTDMNTERTLIEGIPDTIKIK